MHSCNNQFCLKIKRVKDQKSQCIRPCARYCCAFPSHLNVWSRQLQPKGSYSLSAAFLQPFCSPFEAFLQPFCSLSAAFLQPFCSLFCSLLLSRKCSYMSTSHDFKIKTQLLTMKHLSWCTLYSQSFVSQSTQFL